MKIKGILISSLASLLLTGVAGAQEISLEQMVDSAMQSSTFTQQETVLRDMGESLSKALWNAYLPQFSIEGRLHYQTDVTKMAFEKSDDPMVSNMLSKIKAPEIPKLQYQAVAQATQIIWDGGRVAAGEKQILANTETQIAQTKIEARQIRSAVTELYFSLLMLDKQIEMQDNLLTELNRQKQKVERALANGVATKNSLDEIHVEELKAEQQKTETMQSRRSILDALEVYTGMKLDDGVKATKPGIIMRAMPRTKPKHFAPARPENMALDAQLKVVETEWQTFRSTLMPTLALFAQGGYGRPGLNMMNPDPAPFFIYGVKFNWAFGQLYNISSQKKKRQYAVDLIELKRQTLEQQMKAERAQYINEAEQYRQLLEQDEKILALRKEIRDRAEVQVDEGTMTTYDQLQRITSYQMAEQTKALHEILMLRASHRQMMVTE